MKNSELQQLDLSYNWHPCSQMKDYETFKPLIIQSAKGSYLECSNGKKIIDAISSWWCKSLGHNHPKLKQALLNQLERFEHVIFANTTDENIAKLSQKLCQLMPHLNKAFYTGDGSCAVEVAMKMSLHSRILNNHPYKNKFIALKNGYHGETFGALSVSDLGLYKNPYQSILFEPILIEPLYVSGPDDPNWNNAEEHWNKIKPLLNQHCESTTAIILEPIVQGAGGMKIYSQDFLARLAQFAKANNIHLIADEIMTGLGRTGKMLASEHALIQPDFVCLSKGLTSGWLSFSAVLTTDSIYQLFYDDYKFGKSFLHSNTYSGNALGVSLALAVLDIFEQDTILTKTHQLQIIMKEKFKNIANKTGLLKNIRGIGGVIAADLIHHNLPDRAGFKLYQKAIENGALLRPLGNTIYWLPPLNINLETLSKLEKITIDSINSFHPRSG